LIASYYIAHVVTRSVPYVGTILDSVYAGLNSIYNLWYDKPTPPDGTGSNSGSNTGYWNRDILPESISRSNSDDSNITIRDLRTHSPESPITPTTTPQILPLDRYYSEDIPSIL
jgi:hypothetical protein